MPVEGFIPVRPAEGIERLHLLQFRFFQPFASSRYDPLRVLKARIEYTNFGSTMASSRYDPLRVLKVRYRIAARQWSEGFIPVRPAEGIERYRRRRCTCTSRQKASSRYDPLRVLKVSPRHKAM